MKAQSKYSYSLFHVIVGKSWQNFFCIFTLWILRNCLTISQPWVNVKFRFSYTVYLVTWFVRICQIERQLNFTEMLISRTFYFWDWDSFCHFQPVSKITKFFKEAPIKLYPPLWKNDKFFPTQFLSSNEFRVQVFSEYANVIFTKFLRQNGGSKIPEYPWSVYIIR